MSKVLNLLIILTIINLNICKSTYIKSDELFVIESDQIDSTQSPPITQSPNSNEILQQETVSDISQSSESTLSSSETEHVLTGDLFEVHMTIKHDWSDDFLDKNSKTFKDFSSRIDMEILSFLDNSLEMENSVQRGSVVLMNVLPSSIDEYVYVTLIFEASEHVSGQIFFEKLDLRRLTFDKIYELEIKSDGFDVVAISNEELTKFDKHIECDNEFCKSTSQLTPNDLNSVNPEQQPEEFTPEESNSKCNPNEKIQRGLTSIYIFDNNQHCVENVKKRSLSVAQKCETSVEKEELSDGSEEDLDLAASEIKTHADKSVNEKDDEVIVVVRKRGDKVFIEI